MSSTANVVPKHDKTYSPDRKGEHPERHLEKFRGTLQADAYAGFNQLYENGRIQQATCWAHGRRKFYDLEQAHASRWHGKPWGGSAHCMGSKNRFAAVRQKNAAKSATRRPSRYSTLCDSGSKRPC